MGSYDRIDLTRVNEELFGEACMAVLLVFGPPPLTPSAWHVHNFNPTSARSGLEGLNRRNEWLGNVESFVHERYHVWPSRVGDFIIAFEIWYSFRKEDAEHERSGITESN